MKQIVNFSGYSVDLARFDNSWDEVRKFCRIEGLAGIELLLGGEHENRVPGDLVSSVHLPGWLGWIRLWKEPDTIPKPADPLEMEYYFGGCTQEKLLDTFRAHLEKAARLDPAYAVFHITHIELADFFTRKHRYSTDEVLTSAASFLNAACDVFPGGKPPVTLGLENLWWPGLTFSSREETQILADSLEFDNWHYVLDTGHLMNHLLVTDEKEGIDGILTALSALDDETRDKIRSVHFQCSTSGQYQRETFYRDPPEGFFDLSYSEKIAFLMPLVGELDQHRAFTDPHCRMIIRDLSPEYLVHEFVTRSREELEEKLHLQKQALGFPCR